MLICIQRQLYFILQCCILKEKELYLLINYSYLVKGGIDVFWSRLLSGTLEYMYD